MPYDDANTTPVKNVDSSLEHAVFRGLTPRSQMFLPACDTPSRALRTGTLSTVPLLMTSSLATGVIALPQIAEDKQNTYRAGQEETDTRPGLVERLHLTILPIAHGLLSHGAADAPPTYTVQDGDTVSSIADRFGIPTPAILTLNGLSWNALLHPGQVLKLTTEPTKKKASSPVRVSEDSYLVQYGDSISTIADRLGISTRSLLEHNQLSENAAIFPGQRLGVPGSTKATIERDAMPTLAPAPEFILASESVEGDNDQEELETSQPTDDVFDAADMPLTDKPALITVRVGPKPAPVKKPAPVQAPVSTPAQSTETPASSNTTGQPVSGTITPLNDERRANAQVIIQVGRELGVSDYGIVIALATAMQESSLRNINWGDRDSLGLFQQRPSSGWGSAEQIMDPAYSTRLFFGGPSNPNKGRTRGLLDISGWQNMALTDAAQRVQISAYPQAYAKWEPSAWAWLYELT